MKKSRWIDDMCHNVKFAHISISAIRENAHRVTESAKSGTKEFV